MVTNENMMTDEEWREETFAPDVLISARLSRRQGEQVSFEKLAEYIEKYGPDGVLETAVLLPRSEYEALEKLCKGVERPARRPRRRHA